MWAYLQILVVMLLGSAWAILETVDPVCWAACKKTDEMLQLELMLLFNSTEPSDMSSSPEAPVIDAEKKFQFRAGSFGTIQLDDGFKFDQQVGIYSGKVEGGSEDTFILKHMNDCREKLSLDGFDDHDKVPLTREYIFSKVLESIEPGLVPEMKWVSPLVPLSDTNKDDWGFDWKNGFTDPAYTARCIEEGGSVRSIVEQKVGKTVQWYLSSFVSMIPRISFVVNILYQQMLIFTRTTFKLLERLHATGVIHGDMHWDNIAFTKNSMEDFDSESLSLIDLGSSATICGSQYALKTSPHYPDLLRSPWQFIPNENRGFRDDIFQTLQMLSICMSFYKMIHVLSDSDTVLDFKLSYSYFGSDVFVVPINAEIGKALNELVDYVRKIPTFDTPIDYKFIYSQLDKAEAALKSDDAAAENNTNAAA